jgi:hypothetical protein
LTLASARFIEPMLSLAVPAIPEGTEWAYEIKFDGYRTEGIKTGGRVQPQVVLQRELQRAIPVDSARTRSTAG